MKRIAECSALSLTILLFAAPATRAVDGVVQLNQARALAGYPGIGDDPGFPITIRRPGSYRLTGELSLLGIEGAENVDAISTQAGPVTIDLNGFRILGPFDCTLDQLMVSCDSPAIGNGIDSGGRPGIVIRNGSLSGFADRCIALGSRSMVENASVSDCGQVGIEVGSTSGVRRSNVSFSGGDGIRSPSGGAIIEGCRVFRTAGDGIEVGGGSLVTDNVISLTEGFGLRMEMGGGYSGNVLSFTDGGTVTGTGLEIGPNVCAESTTCP